MAKVVTDDKHYKDIANSLRSYIGGDNQYKPEEMASMIGDVSAISYNQGIDSGYSSGYEIGYEEGTQDGYEIGWDDGIDAGYEQGFSEGADSVDIYDLGEKTSKTEGFVIYRGLAANGNCTQTETVSMDVIPTNCFRQMTTLKKVIVGEGTYNIRNSAFSGCTALAEIVLPNSLQYLQNACFSGCTALDNIHLPKGMLGVNAAFGSCTGITTFTVEEGFNCDLPLGACQLLSTDSVIGIIDNYANNSGKTLTLHGSVMNTLAAIQGEADENGEIGPITKATNKGLTIAEA